MINRVVPEQSAIVILYSDGQPRFGLPLFEAKARLPSPTEDCGGRKPGGGIHRLAVSLAVFFGFLDLFLFIHFSRAAQLSFFRIQSSISVNQSHIKIIDTYR